MRPASGRPTDWLVEHVSLMRRGGRVLDLACGSGRHALYLARRGFVVHAVDLDTAALDGIGVTARDEGLAVTCGVCDLEATPSPDLGEGRYDVIVVVHYLHRPLFPALTRALTNGGLLVYETFTLAQAARGRPTNPAFLLQPGELPGLAAPLRVLHSREGDIDGRHIASIVAQR